MYARPLFVVVGISKAFSSEVPSGSREENASGKKQACFGPFLQPRRRFSGNGALASLGSIGYTLAG
jgi:hypothetical protein